MTAVTERNRRENSSMRTPSGSLMEPIFNLARRHFLHSFSYIPSYTLFFLPFYLSVYSFFFLYTHATRQITHKFTRKTTNTYIPLSMIDNLFGDSFDCIDSDYFQPCNINYLIGINRLK